MTQAQSSLDAAETELRPLQVCVVRMVGSILHIVADARFIPKRVLQSFHTARWYAAPLAPQIVQHHLHPC